MKSAVKCTSAQASVTSFQASSSRKRARALPTITRTSSLRCWTENGSGSGSELKRCCPVTSSRAAASNLPEAASLRILLIAVIAFAPTTATAATHRRPTIRYFIATAYSVEGTGAAGKWSHPGTVAADRKILPLNSRIRVYGAGQYSGDYTVEDTGGSVDGHHIDIYMPSRVDAKKFGRQRVKVVILQYGDNAASPPD